MQVFWAVSGDEVAIPFDETLAALKRSLPGDFPVVKAVVECFETAGEHLGQLSEALRLLPDEQGDEDALVNLIWTIEDWKRGIRDWEEVEEKLKDVRRAPV
jgi:hypothetical protein